MSMLNLEDRRGDPARWRYWGLSWPWALLQGARRVGNPGSSMFKRAVTLSVLIVAVACAGTAAGAERWSVKGAGWGHGIGMSQWGAYGYAKHGASYRDIIGHYYRGTVIGRVPEGSGTTRVLLQPNRSTVYFRHATQAGDRGLTE